MEHAQVVKLNTVERYLLSELSATERDEFEEHYFECTDCAAEVKAGAAFIDNARESMRGGVAQAAVGQQRKERWDWFGWLRPAYPFAVIAGLVLAIGYQNFVTIPRIKRDLRTAAAQALPTLSLTTSGSRGEAGVAEIAVPPNSPFGIYLDVPANERFTSYSCAIRTRDGKAKFDIGLSAAQTRDTVELFIPGGTLDPGSYQVVIFGSKANNEVSASEEVARYPFVVEKVR